MSMCFFGEPVKNDLYRINLHKNFLLEKILRANDFAKVGWSWNGAHPYFETYNGLFKNVIGNNM